MLRKCKDEVVEQKTPLCLLCNEQINKVKEDKTILHSNLTLIAIIAQASFLNAAAQPWVGEGADASLAIAFKLIPLLLASIWMASNHRYEIDKIQRAKNTKTETCYCICQAAIAAVGYINHWTLLTAVLIIAAEVCYIFIVNPKCMNRKLVHRKK